MPQYYLAGDGGLKTGLDVIKAAIFGAEACGFGTARMIAMGCKYLRICHLNNCATGVATQHVKIIDEQFNGEVKKVQNFFLFIAEEVRHYLAELGYQSIDQIVEEFEDFIIKDISSHEWFKKNKIKFEKFGLFF